MDLKKTSLIVILIVVVLFFSLWGLKRFFSEKPIGGERDEHGCLVAAGYSWCEPKKKCLRSWEEACAPNSEVKNFEDCVKAGYPVLESFPRQCRTPDGKVFTEAAGELTEESCKAAGGNWNTCSSRCRLDNQGKDGVVCAMLCEALCECGGIAGFGCPPSYVCRTPRGVADALGYCISGTKPSQRLTLEEAMRVAGASECAEKGRLTNNYVYNGNTGTWWIDLDMKQEYAKEMCSPACVVSDESGTAEINWRCTGLLPK
jgi:hypothetical protein